MSGKGGRRDIVPASTSISRAHKLLSVVMGTTNPDRRFTSRASPRECAGSVDTSSVRNPLSDKAIAIAELLLVFPTPPLPPTKTNCVPSDDCFFSADRFVEVDKLLSRSTMCKELWWKHCLFPFAELIRATEVGKFGERARQLDLIEKERTTVADKANPTTSWRQTFLIIRKVMRSELLHQE